ncbi:alanine dehydrogenase [Acidithiobacillus thiooxidans]|uniref:Alanine dehydrogenase n=1 Tax=Acidithiobacillus thiooxidans ATCC 19377 TaxID=637390 RepID=A0A543PZZ2_ACITH|nr:alanine dehydrogenase [Acidithiobacillus thiooxidans]MDX5936355.1 alanine dehydrogenase [Acidithiobacillus thiooxidans]TQN49641.1 Alanine dehydrogenase [Acidithiobacillus thiooxidans ATCC 19377]
MKIGIPKEIKNNEYRVGMTPAGVRELAAQGHQVFIEQYAGTGIGKSDDDYRHAGADILNSAEAVFAESDMIVKVKEPQAQECEILRPGQILFTYLHLAPDPKQAELLMRSGAIAIAYETVTDNMGRLPLLAPMSEVAGRMAVQVGAHALEKAAGGAGILLAGVPGVVAAKVVVLGGGVVGINAARMAMGLGADVTIIDKSIPRLAEIDGLYGPRLKTLYATTESVEENVFSADLVIGAVLVPGASAPKLVTKAMLPQMKAGSVLVDVAIDQGGCFETSRATTHAEPTYILDGIVHYCVANMPGAVARTSTYALTNATLPYILRLANLGWKNALRDDIHFRNGLNVVNGAITCPAVAEALDIRLQQSEKVFS